MCGQARYGVYLLMALVACVLVRESSAFDCPCWSQSLEEMRRSCPPLPAAGCPAGVTPDACGCCDECAKAVNETCGGPWFTSGTCGGDLVCATVGRPLSGWWTKLQHFSNFPDGVCMRQEDLAETGAPCGGPRAVPCEGGEVCEPVPPQVPARMMPPMDGGDQSTQRYGQCVEPARAGKITFFEFLGTVAAVITIGKTISDNV